MLHIIIMHVNSSFVVVIVESAKWMLLQHGHIHVLQIVIIMIIIIINCKCMQLTTCIVITSNYVFCHTC